MSLWAGLRHKKEIFSLRLSKSWGIKSLKNIELTRDKKNLQMAVISTSLFNVRMTQTSISTNQIRKFPHQHWKIALKCYYTKNFKQQKSQAFFLFPKHFIGCFWQLASFQANMKTPKIWSDFDPPPPPTGLKIY